MENVNMMKDYNGVKNEYLKDSMKLNNIKFLLEEFELGGIDVFALVKKIELIIKNRNYGNKKFNKGY